VQETGIEKAGTYQRYVRWITGFVVSVSDHALVPLKGAQPMKLNGAFGLLTKLTL